MRRSALGASAGIATGRSSPVRDASEALCVMRDA
jgi:hypothetical protein